MTKPHASIPRNPLLAEPLFLSGYAEHAGTGTLDMIALCRDANLRSPEFRQDGGSFVQTMWRPAPVVSEPSVSYAIGQITPQVTPQDKQLSLVYLHELAKVLQVPTPQVTPQVANMLNAASVAHSREDLQRTAALSDREHLRKTYLEPLLKAGWLERTIPDKPTSRLQQYRLTEKGRAWLSQQSRSG